MLIGWTDRDTAHGARRGTTATDCYCAVCAYTVTHVHGSRYRATDGTLLPPRHGDGEPSEDQSSYVLGTFATKGVMLCYMAPNAIAHRARNTIISRHNVVGGGHLNSDLTLRLSRLLKIGYCAGLFTYCSGRSVIIYMLSGRARGLPAVLIAKISNSRRSVPPADPHSTLPVLACMLSEHVHKCNGHIRYRRCKDQA